MPSQKVGARSIFFRMLERIQRDDVFGLAAQLSYFFLLSLFPLLIFLVTLLTFLPISANDLLNVIRDFAPGDSLALIEENLRDILSKNNGGLLSFGVLATLWSGSNGISAIVKNLNRAYGVEENRPFWKVRGTSVILTIAMIFVVVIALLLPVFGKQIGLFAAMQFGISDEFLIIWNAVRWVVSALIIFLVFVGLYFLAPNFRLHIRDTLGGAFLATVGFVLVSFLFSYYVGNFGNYSTTYGSIGGIIVLMIWFYLSGIILLIGGEWNALRRELKHRK
nr:YihY/virulence factor BrkB family protein [Bacillus fonticola]